MGRKAFTLIELLLVVAVLAAAAAILLPAPTPVDRAQRIDLAAGEVAAALRFARDEALRTRRWHGVRITAASERIQVFSLDTTGTPPVETFDVRHPVDKKLYDLSLASRPFSEGVDLDRAEFGFGGVKKPYEAIAFSPDGVPASPRDLTLLDSGLVDLNDGATERRRVEVAAMIGRVTFE
jgi:prepilin-type N-terminal cleavage/methylation domain-containing protein